MHTRRLGSSGLQVSTIGLGGMTFGQVPAGFMAGVAADEKTVFAMLDRAVERGVTLLDTADVYANGLSEQIIGRWLRTCGKRDRVTIATKFGFPTSNDPRDRGGGRSYVTRAVENSLARMQLETIDLYQMHTQDLEVPIEETLEALDALVRAGKIRHAGCSNFTAVRLVESLWIAERRELARFVSLQPLYNLMERGIEMEILPACRRFDVGVISWSPLARGFLSGKYPKDAKAPAGSSVAQWQETFQPVERARRFAIASEVSDIAKEIDSTPARVAIAWTLAQPGISCVLAGARTVEQLDDTLAAAELVLPPAALARLDRVSMIELGYPFDFLTRVNGDWKPRG